MNSDYTDILASDMDQADNYTLTGGSASIAAARVSYVFNLLGPALAVDTACSSALIAIHLASQALQTGKEMTAYVTSDTPGLLNLQYLFVHRNFECLSPMKRSNSTFQPLNKDYRLTAPE